jgi:hypothetical protein
MRNKNDRNDDDEEYPGDGTSYYQACFVSTGSPVLSTLDLWIVDQHDLLGWFGGYCPVEQSVGFWGRWRGYSLAGQAKC